MNITTILQSLADGVENAYDAVEGQGGVIPAEKTTENLPNAISSIGEES